mgnify:CR=1 FL=1
MSPKEIGSIQELWRFPVKSMGGESLSDVRTDSTGVIGDRRWSVRDTVRDELIMCKEFPSLLMCSAQFEAEPQPGFGVAHAQITLPDGRRVATSDPSADLAVSAIVGRPVSLSPLQPPENTDHYRRRIPLSETRMLQLMGLSPEGPFPDLSGSDPDVIREVYHFTTPRGIYKDGGAISYLTTAALKTLEREQAGLQLEGRRFRPNLVIDTGNLSVDTPEHDWKGFDLIIGDTVIHCGGKTIRCTMPMQAQYGGLPARPELAALLMRVTNYHLGATGFIREPGSIKLGDSVYLDTRRELHPVKSDLLPIPDYVVKELENAEPEVKSSFSSMRVSYRKQEAEDIVSLGLKAEPGGFQPYLPGQHITLRLHPSNRTSPLVRSYTISGPQSDQYDYLITVKREGMGVASRHLYDELQVGDEIEAKLPAGTFFEFPEDDVPLVLISNGIGITPLIQILEQVSKARPERQVMWVHATQNSRSHAFKERLATYKAKMPNLSCFTVYRRPDSNDIEGRDYDSTRYLELDNLRQIATMPGARVFLCGSLTFMDNVGSMLEQQLGIPKQSIHIERFGTAHLMKGNGGNTNEVRSIRFERSGVDAEWVESDGSLLELAESLDLPVDAGCRFGNCQACSVKLVEGNADYPELEVNPQPGEILLCLARPTSDLVVEL